MSFLRNLFLQKQLKKNKGFIWNAELKNLKSIKNIKSINIDLIIGIDRQKKTLLENTTSFAKGNFTNNALLWGARGNGKSTLIKSIFSVISNNFKNTRLIQLNKDDIFDIEIIYNLLEKFQKFRFIIFIDDLSFEKIDSEYKIIKSTLDGSIQNQPNNIILYVTSNRRHLMPRDMIDNEKSSAIHTDENVEEKVSLSDRFGLWIGFHNLNQENFLNIVEAYCNHYGIEFSSTISKEAIKWSLNRGNRTGRTAWQFIIQKAAQKDLKLEF